MKIIVPVIIGGIIGFFTNWLAIRMLFRPYEEKYIFGFKLPFTPGLIPKEQERIAINIGRTVEDYLLSPEAIMKFVDEESIGEKTKQEIDRILKGIKEEKLRVKDLFTRNLSIDYSEFRSSLDRKLEVYILKELRSEKLLTSLEVFLEDRLNDRGLQENLIGFIEREIGQFLSDENLEIIINNFLGRQEKNMLADSRKLEEVIPDNLKDQVFNYLDENKRLIGYRVRNFISSPPTERKLKLAISNMVEKNVSRLITAFVPMETISEKIYQALENYIKSDDANDDINIILKSIINDILGKKVDELAGDMLKNIELINIREHMVTIIQDKIDGEDILKYLEDKIIKLDKQPIIDLLMDNFREFLNSRSVEDMISGLIKSSLDRLEAVEVIKLLEGLKLNSGNIYQLLEKIFDTSIRERLPEILDSLNIGYIVENTIKEFDFDFVEKLILDIADRELKAITWLGGLLGGIIGLLTPLLQMI